MGSTPPIMDRPKVTSGKPAMTMSQHLTARHSAQRREGMTQLIAAVLALGCLIGAGVLIGPINRVRKERQFVIDPESFRGLPPDIALLGKLGTFRALAIDWAAIRADRLKQEGKTYEALELHKTICTLAPRYPQVWVNAAWNMAYNISVAQFTPESRWKWVRNGLELLRDRGIKFNPKSVTLYKELSWIYWHKIGDFLDDEHLNYKRALATEIERVLGAPPVTLEDKEYYDWFRKIVDAPHDLDALIDTDADVARLVAKLRDVQLAPDEMLLEFVARYLRPELQTAELVSESPDSETLTDRRLGILTVTDEQAATQRLLSAIRSKVLRERLKLNPERMNALMEAYGPLDWRNAFSHSLYWSAEGDRISQGHENLNRNDQINNARFILFGLQKQIMKGRITLWPDFDDPFSAYIELTPDVRYIPYLFDAYLRFGKQYFGDDERFIEGTPGPNFMTGLVSNMQNWIELLYLEGGAQNLERAENYFAYLREFNRAADGSVQARYQKTLAEFVMGDLYDQLQTYKAATAIVRGFIQRALKQFSLGLRRAGTTSLRRAKQAFDIWQIATKRDLNERRKLQPLVVQIRDEIEIYLTHPRVAPLYKARLWKNLPVLQRQMVWDRSRPYFERLCESQDPAWSFARAFPQPPGMEGFRKTEIKLYGAPRREDVELGKTHKR